MQSSVGTCELLLNEQVNRTVCWISLSKSQRREIGLQLIAIERIRGKPSVLHYIGYWVCCVETCVRVSSFLAEFSTG